MENATVEIDNQTTQDPRGTSLPLIVSPSRAASSMYERLRTSQDCNRTMNLEYNQSGVSVSHLRQLENMPNGPSILGFGRVMQQEFTKACCQEERHKRGIFAIGVHIWLLYRGNTCWCWMIWSKHCCLAEHTHGPASKTPLSGVPPGHNAMTSGSYHVIQ